jgi:hypothetical protein
VFHPRSSTFGRNVSAIEGRVHALEKEIEQLWRAAGRRASISVSTAGDHLSDAIASAVTEIVNRFRGGRRLAGDRAARLGDEAVKYGAKIGNDTLHGMASQVEHRPLVILAVAVGVGILIGMAGGMAGRRR